MTPRRNRLPWPWFIVGVAIPVLAALLAARQPPSAAPVAVAASESLIFRDVGIVSMASPGSTRGTVVVREGRIAYAGPSAARRVWTVRASSMAVAAS